MNDGTPDPTDPVWHQMYESPAVLDAPDTAGGQHAAAGPSQPTFDPAEPWVELAPLQKVSPGAAFELIERLRAAGVPVRGSRPRRAGLFSRGLVNVTLSVPDRLVIKAQKLVADHFAGL